jgi:peroxiredoxin
MRNFIYLAVISAILYSCSTNSHYTVKGKIEGSDSITFYLQKREAGKTVTIDSAIPKKGHFVMKGKSVEYPQMVQLVAGTSAKRLSFFIENSEISINGRLDSLYNAEVKGSKSQEEYKSLLNKIKPLSEEYSILINKYQSVSQSGNTSGIQAIQTQTDSLEAKMSRLQKDFIKKNPASYVVPTILVSLSYEMEVDELDSFINGLDKKIADLPQIKVLKDRVLIMKTVAIGQKAPDFTMKDVNGNSVSLYSKLGSKLLLVDFWASWCEPCRQENPNVVKVYGEFHKKGFDVFSVSLDRSKEAWLKAIDNDKLTWTHVSDLSAWNSGAAKLYAVNSIPANFLLDETGKIIGKNLRGDVLYKKVSEVLGK